VTVEHPAQLGGLPWKVSGRVEFGGAQAQGRHFAQHGPSVEDAAPAGHFAHTLRDGVAAIRIPVDVDGAVIGGFFVVVRAP
jgi:hypothetical protein